MAIAKRIILCLVLIIMLCQIGFGFAWMAGNISTVPGFGDTAEYLNLSDTFALDEYRPILYPLFLRVIRTAASAIGTEYQVLIFLSQTITFFLIAFLFNRTIMTSFFGNCLQKKWAKGSLVLCFTLYELTTPMIMWMNFTVLTDSFALSFLLLMLIGLERFKNAESEKERILASLEVGIGYLLQATIRADRVYSALICIILYAGCCFFKSGYRKRKWEWNKLISISISIVLSVSVVFTVQHFTQKPGNRIKTTLSFVLLDRVAWPHFAENYEFVPIEVKETVSYEEALTFDMHNNNVLYVTAPLIEERVGHDKAQEIYRKIAGTVWQMEPLTVISDISKDVLTYVCAPLSFYLSTKGKWKSTNTNWNVHCLSSATPELTEACRDFYTWSLTGVLIVILFFCLALKIISIFKKRKTMMERIKINPKAFGLKSLILMNFILILWFTLGDGAPPNDRYILSLYLLYDLLLMKLVSRIYQTSYAEKQCDMKQ